jgi:biotin carboxylase
MRRAHEQGGAPHPAFRFTADVQSALDAADELGYPVVLKPTLGAASNYVFRVDTPDQMRARFAQAAAGIRTMSWSAMEAAGLDVGPHGLMVEGFLDGRELLIDALAWDDDVYLGSIVDRITVEGETFDDDVHAAPTSLTADELAAVPAAVRAGARAQGLQRSVLHAEVRFHGGRPFLIEIAVRPGGGGLDHMARLSAGYCPIRAVVDVARGTRPDVGHYRPTAVHTAALCLLSGPGRIEHLEVPPEVAESDAVFFCKITARVGDVIRRPPDGNSILGFLGATGTSAESAIRTATGMAAKIHVDLACA